MSIIQTAQLQRIIDRAEELKRLSAPEQREYADKCIRAVVKASKERTEAERDQLQADNAQLRAQLRERTQWQCACGGTDCAGQAENERLRAEVERQTRETTKWAQSLLARTEAAEVRAARWKEQAEFSETQRTKLDGENDQLRARVAELEQDKARLDWLSTRFPDDDAGDCDPEGIERKWMSVWENSTEGSILRDAIDAARAGKGAP